MLVEMDEVSRERRHADDPDQVSFPRLEIEFDILGIVEEGCIRSWHCARRIFRVRKITFDLSGHLLVVPVGQGEDDFFAVLVFVRRSRIVNDEGSTKPIGVLALVVCMIPVRPGLVDLRSSLSLVSGIKLRSVWPTDTNLKIICEL